MPETSVYTMQTPWVACILSSPWAIFKAQFSGRKPGCSVRLVVFFAMINAYNRGWIIAFKVLSASVAGGSIILMLLVITGVMYIQSR